MKDPLQGKNIVVTRDPSQSGNLVKKLSALGVNVYTFPTIKITPPENWSSCDRAFQHIKDYEWIIFSSVNGVRFFLKRAEYHQINYFQASIASVGQKTAEELKKYGITADLIPSSFTAKGLLDVFKNLDIRSRKILLPTSDLSRDELVSGLRKMGAEVDKVICYRTGVPDSREKGTMVKLLNSKKVDCYTFYSPSAFLSFIKILGTHPFKNAESQKAALAAIGPTTARAIRDEGYSVDIQPEKSIDESMIEAIIAYFNKKNE
jgi:uroporphyrinogen III methyltransferase/synthase